MYNCSISFNQYVLSDPQLKAELKRLATSSHGSIIFYFSSVEAWHYARSILRSAGVREIHSRGRRFEGVGFIARKVKVYSFDDYMKSKYVRVFCKKTVFGYEFVHEQVVVHYNDRVVLPVAELCFGLSWVGTHQKMWGLFGKFDEQFDVLPANAFHDRGGIEIWRPKYELGLLSSQCVIYNGDSGRVLQQDELDFPMDVGNIDDTDTEGRLVYPIAQLEELERLNIDAAVTSQPFGLRPEISLGGYFVVSKRLWSLLDAAGLVPYAIPVEFVDE